MTQQSLTVDEAISKARKLVKAGDLATAEKLYQQILARSPQNKKIRNALKSIQSKSTSAQPNSELQAEMTTLMQWFTGERFDQAKTQAKHLTQRYPNQPVPFNILGVIEAGRNNNETAVAHYKDALAIEPGYIDAICNLGTALQKLGRYAEAEHNFLKAIKLSPKDPEIIFNLANVLQDARKLEEATRCYEKSIEIRPLYAPAHFQLGNSLRLLGKSNKAIASYRNTIDIDKNLVEAYINLGEVLQSRQLHEIAISWFRDAIELRPNRARAHRDLARSLLATGNRSDAIESFNTCLELDPGSGEARHLLSAARHLTPDTAPRDYVSDLFDTYAPSFEKHLKEGLGYQAPALLKQLVVDSGILEGKFEHAVDLGCGTGLAGEEFNGICKTLWGVDISEKMLEQAKEKTVYDQLFSGDITSILPRLNTVFDLFICSDTLVYVGKLEPFFATVAAYSTQGSLLTLSTELNTTKDLELLPTGRYAHSKDYVTRSATSAGFALIDYQEHKLRKEADSWLDGGYYLFHYKGAL